MLVNITNITFGEFKDMCAYMLWAKLDKLILKFNVTKETYDYCSAVGDSKLYGVSFGVPDLWQLGSMEFLNQLKEMIEIV